MMSLKKRIARFWQFLWYEDSLASWIVNLLLAFVLVKFVLYPGIGFLLGTSYPIVAVVSGSMEHDGLSLPAWWEGTSSWYLDHGIAYDTFAAFPFANGFNKGDIMVIIGVEPQAIKRGDVVVYENPDYRNPIIHRIVEIHNTDGTYSFTTKGDHNPSPDKRPVTEEHIKRTGKAVFRIPFLGWIKIWFVQLLGGS